MHARGTSTRSLAFCGLAAFLVIGVAALSSAPLRRHRGERSDAASDTGDLRAPEFPKRGGARRLDPDGRRTGAPRGTLDGAVSLVVGAAPFLDIPSEEVALGAGLAQVPSVDGAVEAFARPDGRLAVILQDEYRVLARFSVDGGRTFDPEQVIGGGPGQLEVVWHAADMAADGTIFVALVVIDPSGELGLQVVRSAYAGGTWSAPVDVVRHGSPAHGLVSGSAFLRMAAGPPGRAAVLFCDDLDGHYFVSATTNGGLSWSAPVRIDPGAPEPLEPAVIGMSLAIGQDGSIHAAYSQYRETFEFISSLALVYTRSTDGGMTFAPEKILTITGRNPTVAVAADASILVASASSSRVRVHRSTDGGATFLESVSVAPAYTGFRYPVVRPSPESGTVLLGGLALDPADPTGRGPLLLWRSTDYGATFSPAQVISAYTRRLPNYAIRPLSGGIWAAAWTDNRFDDYALLNTDVMVSVSGDDGATWSAPARADSHAEGSAQSILGPQGLAIPGPNDLAVAFTDGRDDARRSLNAYVNRSTAFPLVFGHDQRIDDDGAQVPPAHFDVELATDGAQHPYAAFVADATGPYSDLFVVRSRDGGRSFEPPIRVGASPPGSRIHRLPQVLARPDGNVYVAYEVDEPQGGGRRIYVARSPDFGQDWTVSPAAVGTTAAPCGPGYLCGDFAREDVQFALGPGGSLYLAWTDDARVWFARSSDHGASFTSTSVDRGVGYAYYGTALCAAGSQVVLAFMADDGTFFFTAFAAVSLDGGLTWPAPQAISGHDTDFALSCAASPDGAVLVSWYNSCYGTTAVYANRWNGQAWQGITPVVDAFAGCYIGPMPKSVFSDANHLVMTYDAANAVHASVSVDGGRTFLAPQRLDLEAPVPAAYSFNSVPVADGQGNVWVIWDDGSAGDANSLAIRHSGDHGRTFGPVYRLNRNLPQGGRETIGFWIETPVATLPGKAVLAYLGKRSSAFHNEVLVNGYDTSDLDGDGAAAGADCDDADPSVKAPPGPVSAVSVAHASPGVTVRWEAMTDTAGRGTRYDIVGGDLDRLAGDRDYSAASCLSSGLQANRYDDPAAPPIGRGTYYLVRARNGCGIGSYGDSGQVPDPRDALDAMGPCP